MRLKISNVVVAALCLCGLAASTCMAADDAALGMETTVARVIQPVMQRYGIPGMAVAIVAGGQRHQYGYGVMSKATGKPVTSETLFEIGSVSKTFAATLAAYAQADGQLSLSDPASQYLPALHGTSFDSVSLLNLGTHTFGGMPLQVPDDVTNNAQLMQYFKNWKPTYPAGTYRTYANPSVGLLGMIAAKTLQDGYDTLVQGRLFQALGLRQSFLQVPESEMANYAQGYTKTDEPIRMAPGVLASEAYGVRTTAGDLLRFVEANMALVSVEPRLQQALTATHTGYYRLGAMTQDLIWEQYPYPVGLDDLRTGNSAQVSFQANPVVRIDPPSPPRDDVLINKTGSTNGFGAYVAFVPARKFGIVLLANKNYPIEARVSAAYEIMTRLIEMTPAQR